MEWARGMVCVMWEGQVQFGGVIRDRLEEWLV